MGRLAAIAELRLRGAVAARLPWLIPLALACGFACAAWAPGTDAAARASAADGIALGAAAATALLGVLVLAATAFAGEIRTGIAHTLLSAPVARATVSLGGAAGHALFGLVLVLGLAAAATVGLDLGGLGARAREPVRALTAAAVLGAGADRHATASDSSPEVRVRFRVPEGLEPGEPLRFRLSPRGQVESDWDAAGVVAAAAGRAESAEATIERGDVVRVRFKAAVAFAVDVPRGDLRDGEEGELVLRRERGGWLLRFGPGSVHVAGPRELFAVNVVRACLCLLPLLAVAAAAGTAASARLGAGASLALVLFLLLLVAGREVIVDGAAYIVEQAEAQRADEEEASHDAEPGHDAGAHGEDAGHGGHAHGVRVTGVQALLARGALAGMRAVPDAGAFWRFGDLAEGRAVTGGDVGRAWLAGLAPCAVLAAAAWLLLRRRELL